MKNRCNIRKYSALLALVVSAVLCITTACKKDIHVTGVTLNPPAVVLTVGETKALNATVAPADATNKTVTWSTNDERVATVNSAGELTAVAPGTVTITATTDDGGFTATCIVTVEEEVIPVTGVTFFYPPTRVLLVGNTLTLSAVVKPATATYKTVTWSTSDDRVVTVNAAGEITAVAPGTVTITATTADGKYTATCTVAVPVPGTITMTTLTSEVSFRLDIPFETEVLIEWGDGAESNLNDAFDIHGYERLFLNFSHNYSSASAHTISINGIILGLVCYNNQLTTLDVSGNTALEVLDCYKNQLTTLNVSGNTVLTYLNCAYNQLTTLEVSNNTPLIYFRIYNNQLTTSALNDLFISLHDNILDREDFPKYFTPYNFSLYGNPGANDCDVSIAQEKGWGVHPTLDDL